jgi:hypothetical protein
LLFQHQKSQDKERREPKCQKTQMSVFFGREQAQKKRENARKRMMNNQERKGQRRLEFAYFARNLRAAICGGFVWKKAECLMVKESE